jgi:hypothetical protein
MNLSGHFDRFDESWRGRKAKTGFHNENCCAVILGMVIGLCCSGVRFFNLNLDQVFAAAENPELKSRAVLYFAARFI